MCCGSMVSHVLWIHGESCAVCIHEGTHLFWIYGESCVVNPWRVMCCGSMGPLMCCGSMGSYVL